MGTIVIQADDGKDWSAIPTDEFDMLYILNGVGWSRCYLYLQNEVKMMAPTHIWGSPLNAMLEGMTCFLEGEEEVNFTWYDEPGTYDWYIKRDGNDVQIIEIEIIEYGETELDLKLSSSTSDASYRTSFKVKENIFCACLLKQVEKIELLMKEKSYRDRRVKDFDPAAIKKYKDAFKKVF